MVTATIGKSDNNFLKNATRFVPKVNSRRCVHAVIGIASCVNCVKACPHQAWQLSDESLTLDTKACTGCALCVAACPEAAIEYDYQPQLREYQKHNAAFFACEKINDKNIKPTIPCLHAVGLYELLRLYQHGVRLLITASSNCETCDYAARPGLKTTVKLLNKMLESSAQEKIKHLEQDTKKFGKWLNSLKSTGQRNDRRGFLKNMLASGAKAGLPVRKKTGLSVFSLAELIPGSTDSDSILPFIPQIDDKLCNVCGACIKVCTHQALALDQEQHEFKLTPKACTGCMICVDICDENAINIRKWQKPETLQMELDSNKCKSCGVEFYSPKAGQTNAEYCHICSVRNKNSNLYQIVDV